DLLDGDHGVHQCAADATVGLRQRDAHQSLCMHALGDIEGKARIVRALERAGCELRARELAHGFGEQLLLLGEFEVHRHSALAPDCFTTADHLISSRSMSAAYSSGVESNGSVPSLAMRSLVSGALTASRSATESLSMIGRGVPAGATIP